MEDITDQLADAGNALNPLSEDKAEQRSHLFTASMVSAAASIGTGFLTKDKLKSRMIRNSTFFTATFAAGMYSDIDHGDSPSTAILVNSLTAVAGIVAFTAAKKLVPSGFRALAGAIEEHTGNRSLSLLSERFAQAVKNVPQIEYFLNKDTIGLAGSSVTIPVAHSLVHRIVADGHRRRINSAPMAHQSFKVENQAGDSGDQTEMSGERPVGTNEIKKATFNTVMVRSSVSNLTRMV